jgi:hypothetical protein
MSNTKLQTAFKSHISGREEHTDSLRKGEREGRQGPVQFSQASRNTQTSVARLVRQHKQRKLELAI